VGKFFKDKICIYLDQFAVSNIVDCTDKIWADIGKLILNGVAAGKFIVPYSFEHLLETSNKAADQALLQDKFLFELSGGLKMNEERIVTAKILRNRIRKRKDEPTTYTAKIDRPFMDSEDTRDKFGKLHTLFKAKTEQSILFLNTMREASQKHRFSPDLSNAVISHMMKQNASCLTRRFEDYSKFGSFQREPVRFSDIIIPHWADVIMDTLIGEHKITRKEFARAKQLLKNNGIQIIPTIYVRSLLEAVMGIKQQKENVNDHVDLMRLTTAIPFADIVVTDKARSFDVKYLKLDAFFNTQVFSGGAGEILSFKNILGRL
jgi:hypothetical protein